MPSKAKGPSGTMTIYDNWIETANSHKETTGKSVLSVVDGFRRSKSLPMSFGAATPKVVCRI